MSAPRSDSRRRLLVSQAAPPGDSRDSHAMIAVVSARVLDSCDLFHLLYCSRKSLGLLVSDLHWDSRDSRTRPESAPRRASRWSLLVSALTGIPAILYSSSGFTQESPHVCPSQGFDARDSHKIVSSFCAAATCKFVCRRGVIVFPR